jgi:peptide/nickel transport system substrate-binding protein
VPGGGTGQPPVGTGGVALDDAPEDGQFVDHLELILDNNAIAVISPFSPAGGTSSAGWAQRMLGDSLVYYDSHTQTFIPMLAHDWYISSDAMTFRFYLREDVYFHTGVRMTSDDVLFTTELASMYPGTNGAFVWDPIASVNVIDEFTIEFTLREVGVEFLFEASNPWGTIYSRAAYASNPRDWGRIGTGPFQVTSFSTNDYVSFERFDAFWGETPPTRSITMRFIPEPSTRLMMMENFEADVAFALGPEDLAIVAANPAFDVIPMAFNNTNILGFNLADPIVGDLYFRLAVAYAIDSGDVALGAAGEWAAPVEDMPNIWGLDQEFRNPDVRRITQDLDQARYYLERSVYNGETIVLTAAILTNVRAAEVIQQQLSVVGINTTINQMDAAGMNAFAEYGANQTQMFVFVSASRFNAGSTAINWMPGGVQNRFEYKNTEVQALISRALVEPDVATRRQMYMDLQEMIAEDLPALNLFWRLNGVTTRTGMGGMNLRSDMMYNLRGVFRLAD